MAVLEPKVALLDETDSGLDIDALRAVAEGVNKLMNPTMGIDDHALSASSRLHQAALRPHHGQRQHHQNRRTRTGAGTRGKGYGWLTGDKIAAEV